MKKTLFTLLMITFLATPVQAVHALGAGAIGCGAASVAVGAGSAAASRAIGAEIPVSDRGTRKSLSALESKECILDGLTVVLREALIASITQSIVDWINNGFEGGPTFVTDLSAFLGEVADNTSLDFIHGTELGFLCSPFELEVRLALSVARQPFREHIRCSLGDVTDNIDGFLSGDFSQGGWPAWFRVHTSLQNHPYGAYYLAQGELNTRLDRRQQVELEKLNYGQGFLSKERCSTNHLGESRCEIVTPGAVINEQLNNTLSSGTRQLELADEIDEIIGALIAQLAQQTFTSLDGLRGLSSRSSSSSRRVDQGDRNGNFRDTPASYLEAIADESDSSSVGAGRTILLSDIDTAIDLEEEYQDVLNGIIANLAEAEEKFGALYQCFVDVANVPGGSVGISSTANDGILSVQEGGVTTTQIERYEQDREISTNTIGKLLAARAETRDARSVSDLNDAADSYDAILASGVVHSSADIIFLSEDFEAQKGALEALNNEAHVDLRECRQF